eukprot:SAG25_NODE_10966_length_318_cov_0.474886_1_plen_54_part_10
MLAQQQKLGPRARCRSHVQDRVVLYPARAQALMSGERPEPVHDREVGSRHPHEL